MSSPNTSEAQVTGEDWVLLEDLFHRAQAIAEPKREAFVDLACADDQGLRRRLVALLQASGGAAEQLDNAVRHGAADALRSAEGWAVPLRLGRYQIEHEIGRGGLSTVYLARRDDQQFDMQVALKVVRPGMDTEDILRRLRQERQILAGLDHPYIARLHDGGTTDEGLPFFVMEYIEGQPIDTYCRDQSLDLNQRLDLFAKVCQAVDYAHRNLVLHRDIKPSNLLVTPEGEPKLLDFGIAKLLEASEPHTEVAPRPEAPNLTRTRTGHRLLTPEYASPEQIAGQTLSTASDVYSLGMLLYLLLTGEPAYRFGSQRASDIERVVCEQQPDRPSSRLARNSDQSRRSAEPLPKPQQLRGDLDKVVLMALHKEPDRRYRSAGDLAADLLRYQRNLPVTARSDTLLYRSRKFFRRHRLAVSMASLLVLVLLAAVSITTHQARLAQRALGTAKAANRISETQADFLIGLFESPDPWKTGGNVTVREVLEAGTRRIRWQLEDDPALRANLLSTMGQAFSSLNLYERSQELLEEAVQVHRQLGDTLGIAAGLRDLASLHLGRGELEAADQLIAQALEMQIQELGDRHPEIATTLLEQAAVSAAAGRLEAAEAEASRALELRVAAVGLDRQLVAAARNRLGEILFSSGRYPPAEALFAQAVEEGRQFGPHPMLALSLNNLAAALQVSGDGEAAAKLMAESLELRIELLGEVNEQVAQALHNLAMLEIDLGDLQSAEQRLERGLGIYRKLFGEEHLSVVDGLHSLGFLHQTAHQSERAEDLYRQAIDLGQRIPGDHLAVSLAQLSLASLLREHDPTGAEALYLQVLELQRRVLPPTDRNLAKTLAELGHLLMLRGLPQRAVPLLQEAVEIRQQQSPSHWTTARAQAQLGECLAQLGRSQEALQILESSEEIYTASLGTEHSATQRVAERLAQLRLATP